MPGDSPPIQSEGFILDEALDVLCFPGGMSGPGKARTLGSAVLPSPGTPRSGMDESFPRPGSALLMPDISPLGYPAAASLAGPASRGMLPIPTPMPALPPSITPPGPICAYAAPVIPDTMLATSSDRAIFDKRIVIFMSYLTLAQRIRCTEMIRHACESFRTVCRTAFNVMLWGLQTAVSRPGASSPARFHAVDIADAGSDATPATSSQCFFQCPPRRRCSNTYDACRNNRFPT
jgi:hypothetical protein